MHPTSTQHFAIVVVRKLVAAIFRDILLVPMDGNCLFPAHDEQKLFTFSG
jgi:hypothetical protein